MWTEPFSWLRNRFPLEPRGNRVICHNLFNISRDSGQCHVDQDRVQKLVAIFKEMEHIRKFINGAFRQELPSRDPYIIPKNWGRITHRARARERKIKAK